MKLTKIFIHQAFILIKETADKLRFETPDKSSIESEIDGKLKKVRKTVTNKSKSVIKNNEF
jgi:hypothetical protein